MTPKVLLMISAKPGTEGRIQGTAENPPAKDRHERLRLDPWVRKIPWRKARQPTPVFLPGEPHGLGSLVNYQSMELHRVRHDCTD